MCYSIALRNHAEIQVQSTPAGTTFYVRFKRSSNFKGSIKKSSNQPIQIEELQ